MAKIENFRFWCQKVLPLVYDDSLSYYELLCKVVSYLNNVITDVNTLSDDFQVLENYVKNYFTNLDVQEEINNKLDEMVTDGTFNTLLSGVGLLGQISLTSLNGKRILIFGDSQSILSNNKSKWVDFAKPLLENAGCEVIVEASEGRTLCAANYSDNSVLNLINNYTGFYDIVILFIGVNDYVYQTPIGAVNSNNRAEFNGGLNTFLNYFTPDKANRVILITPIYNKYLQSFTTPLEVYRMLINNAVKKYGCEFIDVYNYGENFRLTELDDDTHYNSRMASKLSDYIIRCVVSPNNAYGSRIYYNEYVVGTNIARVYWVNNGIASIVLYTDTTITIQLPDFLKPYTNIYGAGFNIVNGLITASTPFNITYATEQSLNSYN